MISIGGYFSLECLHRIPYHENGILLNSGCSALRLAIRHRHLTKLYVPEYTCPVVWNAVRHEGCECIFYPIGNNFLPAMDIPSSAYVLYNNYFGICSKQVNQMVASYPNLIVDNAQAFYMPMRGIASFYSPRKFFGVPDGGILLDTESIELPRRHSQSWQRCTHLLKRWDCIPEAGYHDFQDAEVVLESEEPMLMSNLTKAMLGNCDYETISQLRLNNFTFLHEHLRESNLLSIELTEEDVPLVYPYVTDNANLRQFLIQQKIFVANYWPNVREKFFSKMVALPIDQRYNIDAMEIILKVLQK